MNQNFMPPIGHLPHVLIVEFTGPNLMLILESCSADPSTARRAAAGYCRTKCAWTDPDDVALVVGELVSNAVRHTEGPWSLRLHAGRSSFLAAVSDSSHTPPTPRAPDPEGTDGGYGMGIINRLAGDVTVLRHENGKTVQASWHKPDISYRLLPRPGRALLRV